MNSQNLEQGHEWSILQLMRRKSFSVWRNLFSKPWNISLINKIFKYFGEKMLYQRCIWLIWLPKPHYSTKLTHIKSISCFHLEKCLKLISKVFKHPWQFWIDPKNLHWLHLRPIPSNSKILQISKLFCAEKKGIFFHQKKVFWHDMISKRIVPKAWSKFDHFELTDFLEQRFLKI